MAKLIVYRRDLPVSWKKGHVVEVLEDWQDPGNDVVNGILQKDGSRQQLWRIVQVPGSAEAYRYMIEREERDPLVEKEYPIRKYKLDLDVIESEAEFFRARPLKATDTILAEKKDLESKLSVELAEAVVLELK